MFSEVLEEFVLMNGFKESPIHYVDCIRITTSAKEYRIHFPVRDF